MSSARIRTRGDHVRPRLIAGTIALAAAPVLTPGAPANATEACTTSITANAPYQESSGAIIFPVSMTVCETGSESG